MSTVIQIYHKCIDGCYLSKHPTFHAFAKNAENGPSYRETRVHCVISFDNIYLGNQKRNIKVSHYWPFVRRIQSWRRVINSLRPRPNRRHVVDDIFKCIFENENEWISHRISLKFVPKVRINNIPALVQIMAWRRPGDKPLSKPMMVSLLTYICVTRPQWVNVIWKTSSCHGAVIAVQMLNLPFYFILHIVIYPENWQSFYILPLNKLLFE